MSTAMIFAPAFSSFAHLATMWLVSEPIDGDLTSTTSPTLIGEWLAGR
jgi:hypothetical protein